MDAIAESYARLVLALGRHDANYVDAFYGPEEWKPTEDQPLPSIIAQAQEARSRVDSSVRGRFLASQLDALIARARLVGGEKMSFDEESSLLYGVVDPGRPDSFYDEVLMGLESALPGSGSLAERYGRFREQFYVPADRVEAVFKAAIDASRERTLRYIALPAGEDFRIEYVKGEVWSAYNWYQGNSHSLIQVNTDFPLSIDRALGLACHEGYPGHHVYNALLEQHLVRERNWLEFTVYPLYSPQSLIAEGTAEYGVELNFPRAERLEFERSTLYPLAGLDPAMAADFAEVNALMGKLGYSSNDAARRYLDGVASREETIDWLVKYSLSNPERSAQRVRFFEAHRSYVVTYNLGEDLVRSYVESRASTTEEKWAVFAGLLSEPITPAALKPA